MGLVSKHFLQYPSMERQDLTQGQLGSFKFTPVDAVHQDVNKGFLTAFAQQEMINQLQSSAQRAIAMASDTRSNHPSAMSSNTGFTSLTAATNLTTDLDFFDKRIKSDIGDSRLKYGPAALRSSVESHSPEKTRNQVRKAFSPSLSSHLSLTCQHLICGVASTSQIITCLCVQQYRHESYRLKLCLCSSGRKLSL